MGSIPLPALHLNPPAPPADPTEQLGRILQLRNMMQNAPLQNQALQQQVQAGQMENQQRQLQLNDQKAMTAAMQQWDGKDLNQLPTLVLKNGGSAQAVMGLKQKSLEMQKQYSDIAAQDATTGSKNIETMMKKNDIISGAFSTVLQAPDDQLPQAVVSTAHQLAQQGLLDPQHLQMADGIAQVGDPAQIRHALDTMRKGMLATSQLMEQAQKQASTDKDVAETKKITQETQFGPTGPAAEARYRFILQKQAAGQPLSPDDLNFAKGFEASQAKTTSSSDSLGVVSTNISKPAGLATVGRGATPSQAGNPAGPVLPRANLPSNVPNSPANVKNSIVDDIGQYKMDPALMGRALYKHPELLGMIAEKYPGWDQTTYQAKSALIKGYTSGSQSKEINAINTAMGHIKVLDDAVEALNNGNVQALNSLANKFDVAVGSTPQTTFKAIVHRVGPEITSAYIPGAGGEGERIANEKDFSENMAPQQLHDNAAITVKLLRSKVGALENQYKNAVGRDDFGTRFITPEAQSAFQKFSGGSASSGPAPAEGTVKTNSHGDKIVYKGGQWQLAQ